MLNRLLITGAKGNLGQVARARMHPFAKTLRISDLGDLGDAAPHEELVPCDLGDKDGLAALVEGCDGVLHLGGQSVEAPWEVIRHANIDGIANLFEAARKASRPPRLIFASSNHAIGFYKQSEVIDADVPTRPDSLYGVSKVFGEAMASMYHEKFGIETASIRIGSCFPEPRDHRMLASWLSHDDFIRLIERIFIVPRLGCPIIYGASDNAGNWWDNTKARYIGWTPQDSSESFRAKLDAAMDRPAPNDPRALWQGGTFCADGIHEND